MICPNCGIEQTDGLSECTACGIIFAKYKPRIKSPADTKPREEPPHRSKLVQSVLQGYVHYTLKFYGTKGHPACRTFPLRAQACVYPCLRPSE